MMRALLALSIAAPIALANLGATTPPRIHHAPSPPPPLPALPVLARVRLDVTKERVLLVHEITLARGSWAGGDLDLYASFGPTMPLAFDAHLLPMAQGATAPDPNDLGEPIPTDKASHRPAHAHPLLGHDEMAGEVLHLREAAFRRATAASGSLALRIRQVLAPPPADAQGGHEVVVRLGMAGGTPLTLRRIELVTSEPTWLGAVYAQLCGPSADPYMLGFAVYPQGASRTPGSIDPSFAVRRSTDDLCVRYVTR
jgi:hypothetical protein